MCNVSTTQLTHFIMLVVYMPFCRLKHYTMHMVDRNAALLKSTVLMSLVIMSFRTTFSMKGSHNNINPYFKNLPSVVRRSIHVAATRYIEQECTCLSHVQCDIYPTTFISEVVLPSYQHFLQHIHQTGMTKKLSNESDALKQYGKTTHMLILARVSGYYSPYSPQTIMEEEAKCRYGDVFTLAEREFFKHRLVTLYPQISDEGMETSITFLEQQKLANCPCFVHTEQRGFGWIVFRRQSDKISCDCNDIPEIEDDVTDEDEQFFSAETDDFIVTPLFSDGLTIPNDDASGAATGNNLLSSADFSDNDKANPEEIVSPCDPSLHSRDNKTIHSKDQRNDQKEKNGNNKDEPSPMDFDDSNKADDENNKPDKKTEGKPRRRSRGHYYNPLVY